MGGSRDLTPGAMLVPAASPPFPQPKTTGTRVWDVPHPSRKQDARQGFLVTQIVG